MRGDEKRALRATGCSRCGKLQRQVERLEREIAELRKRLDEAERAGKRQAAPFSKGKPKKEPKKPGRKPGKGYGKRACRPRPEKVDRVLDVPLAREFCSCCGGQLVNKCVREQFVTDIPEVKPTVTQFNVHCADCRDCGHHEQGRHPEQISDALGAAANQIGPRVISLGVELNKAMGASYGKISQFFHDAFDLSVARSTVLRALVRTAKKAEPLYDRINIIVRNSNLVCPDESGWKVGGLREWLWVFVAPEANATIYEIKPSRGFDVIEDILGSDYAGFLARDGWAPYDRLQSATHQLCLGHLINRCSRLGELNTGRALCFPRDIKSLLQHSLELRDLHEAGRITRRTLLNRTADLEWDLDQILLKDLSNNENRKLANHMADHRRAIFSFLHNHPQVPATNHLAEQAIRPAVVNRKMSGGGNRSPRGARAQAVLMSVLRTAWQRGLDRVKLLVDLLRSPDPQKYAAFILGP